MSTPKPYDSEMIRDFLEQLAWELRVEHFDLTTKSGFAHPELIEQLQKHYSKHETLLLASPALSPETLEEVGERLGAQYAAQRQEQINHLEALRDLFEEALFCAEHPGKVIFREALSGDLLPRGGAGATVTAIGVADCHGLDSFDLKEDCLGALYYILRAGINKPRHAVAYLAEISSEYASIVGRLLAAGKKVEALATLRTCALNIRLATGDHVRESWEKIPDPSLDPWSEQQVFDEIKRKRVVKRATVLEGPAGQGKRRNVVIDGRRRMRALKKLGVSPNEVVEAYRVSDDGSQDRWKIFDTVVKSADPPKP